MLEGLLTLFAPRSPLLVLRDVIDVAVVAYVIYRLLLLLRGTRAMQVGLGLAVVVVVYFVAQRLGLATAYSLLDRFLASFLLLVVVIFQADIRRALMGVGNRPMFLRWRKDAETDAVEEVIAACTLLAQRRIGALVVFERDASLEDFAAQGTVLDAEASRELLYTLFLPGYENPLHDGAVVLRNARVWKAGAFLPLTANPGLDRSMGTRHRAAIGISEETDAVVVIVSEERGQISLCFNGNIARGLDAQSLRQALYGLFYPKRRAAALLKVAAQREAETAQRFTVLSGGAAEQKPAAKQPRADGGRERENDPRFTTMRGAPKGAGATASQLERGADRTGAHGASGPEAPPRKLTTGGTGRPRASTLEPDTTSRRVAQRGHDEGAEGERAAARSAERGSMVPQEGAPRSRSLLPPPRTAGDDAPPARGGPRPDRGLAAAAAVAERARAEQAAAEASREAAQARAASSASKPPPAEGSAKPAGADTSGAHHEPSRTTPPRGEGG